jgi:serine/threonine protein kinase
VLVNEDGIVKLPDFGIARLLETHPAMNSTHHRRTGLIALTPEYARPEQIRGQPVTTASDVHSLGVVLYKMLTKHLPYRPGTGAYYDLATQLCRTDPRRPSAVADRAKAARLRGDIDNIRSQSVAEGSGRALLVRPTALAGHQELDERRTQAAAGLRECRRASTIPPSAAPKSARVPGSGTEAGL